MKWFDGSVIDAIQQAKERSSLFIVYVSGTDEISNQMSKTWEDPEVDKKMKDINSICLKLEANSEQCVQFSVYYPVMTVPTTYFIGSDGKQRLIIAGSVEPDELLNKITEAHGGEESPSSQNSQRSLNEKVEIAKERIRQKRDEKETESAEKEKADELKRRTMGRDLAKLKQWQETKDAEETRNQMKKDREEDKKAKERIKAQIERDRAERKARFEESQRRKQEQVDNRKQERLQREAEEKRMEAARRSETARIQFRLPDGRAVNQFFPSNSKLQEAIDYLKNEHSLYNVELLTNFPKRIYSKSEYNSTFSELQLAPSSVITVKLLGGFLSNSGNGKSEGINLVSSLYTAISNSITSVWNMIYSFVFGTPQQPAVQSNRSNSQQQRDAKTSSTSDTLRHRSRIGRLSERRNDDDDMALYNGNSTQQM